MIRVLITEDSPVMADILRLLIGAEPDFEIVGVATNGLESVRLTAKLQPDLITMDMVMPEMDGLEAIKRIMDETPTPIVVISSHVNDKEMKVTFRSLAAGALSVQEKPEDIFAPSFEVKRAQFLKNLRAVADIKVRRTRSTDHVPLKSTPVKTPQQKTHYRLLALGASTGGPQALHKILSEVPAGYPLPILIAQHITRGFTAGMVDWLQSHSSLTVQIAQNNQEALPGHVYFAPDGTDMTVSRQKGGLVLSVSSELPLDVLTPNVDRLFHSVADCLGPASICGILTGMGRDGADGMKRAHTQGAWTFSESEKSCVVYGMPQAAVEKGGVRKTLNGDQIAQHIIELLNQTVT